MSVAVTAGLVAAASSQDGNPVANPSFEAPDVAEGGYIDYPGGASLAGWVATGSGAAVVDGSFTQGEYRFPAADGEQWLDLSGETAGNGGAQQTVSTSPGGQYALSWSVGNVSGGGFGETSSVAVLIDGRQVRTVTNSQPGTTLQWQRFTQSFIATDSTTVIEFRTADPTSDPSNGLDDVSMVEAAGPPAPTLGRTATVRPVRGEVLIGIPSRAARAAQKGVEFVPLEEARSIPIGSFLDTTKGTVALTTARNRAGRLQSGRFSAGLFQVLQSRKRRAKGLTELRLKGQAAALRRCRSDSRTADASRLSRRAIRRLRARARGRYRTRGRRSAATVRGTVWITKDSCAGTLTTVKRGRVAVRDFRRKKTIVLTRGKSYLAR